MNTNFESLEFYAIIEKLKEHALSDKAKESFNNLTPFLSEDACIRKMAETTAARRILDISGSPPLPSMKGMDEIVSLAVSGAMLIPEQLTLAAQFAASCKRMESYLSRSEAIDETVAFYGRSILDLSELRQEIERCVRSDTLSDEASPALRDIRRKIEHTEAQIKDKLNQILKSRKALLADNYFTYRNGHYVLPVQRKYQNQFGGTVIEASAKGSTVFMEPSSISKLQAELSAYSIDEDAEVRRILYTLSSIVAEHAYAINFNMEAMEVLDILFAKAKLSAAMKARPVEIGGARKLDIRQGCHPLLDYENCIPLDIRMDEATSGVIITGPNTGGKTVALKTVGLLSLMAQCALHIPCGEGSYIAMQDDYFCDIGDNQNISQNLSTFSGHMTNIIRILDRASRDSLVLLDELGSGTDPAEGMGIAIAVLEELKRRNCMFIVTTHYPQIKDWSEESEGILSARMAFDRESLRPLYLLEMGKTGESCALHIAKQLGLAEHLLARAHHEVYGESEEGTETPLPQKMPKSKLERALPPEKLIKFDAGFQMGDSVLIMPDGEGGIVYRPADDLGNIIVQVKGIKRTVKHTRLQLQVAAEELYPPGYDFSIIFDSVENRKAGKQMGKRHDPNLVIRRDEE